MKRRNTDIPGRRIQDRRLNPKEGHRRASWLRLDGPRERRHHDTPGLRLPERIDDGALSPSDVVVVPVPCLGIDGFAYATEDTER